MNYRLGIKGAEESGKERGNKKAGRQAGKPVFSAALLAAILLGCLCAGFLAEKDPSYMDLVNYNLAPNREFLFGTDAMGRDIYSMIWHGGRISLFIGFGGAVIALLIALLCGALSGLAPRWLDALLMRIVDIFLAVPNLLFVALLLAVLGKADMFRISLVIGATSWMSIAKVVRTEVRQLKSCEYVIAARCMGAGFFHILWKHLIPNVLPSIMFMAVMNVRNAIIAESTLSFMGIGLPLEVVSWGSMLALSEKAILSRSWWIIVIPGVFLTVTLVCVTNLGNYLRQSMNHGQGRL